MLLDQLHTQREVIAALGLRYGARHMRVFGSVARREERPDSDVDLLVELDRGYDLFGQRLPLTDRLSELLGRRVDLVPARAHPSGSRAAVNKTWEPYARHI